MRGESPYFLDSRLNKAEIVDGNVDTNEAKAAPIQTFKIGLSYHFLHTTIDLMSVASQQAFIQFFINFFMSEVLKLRTVAHSTP
jgi:hypothetical protein